jgi:hypothetical protein
VKGAGVSLSQGIVRTSEGGLSWELSLPVAEAGQLTTRSSDTAGTITMDDAGHGITTGEIIDIYDPAGGTVSYGATVGTVAGDSVPFTGASGDVLPANLTNVTVAEQVILNTPIDGDAILIIAIIVEFPTSASTDQAHLDMQDSGNATIEEIDLTANGLVVHDITGGDTNVFTGNPITHIHCSQGGVTEACTLKIIDLEDATP